MEMEELIGIHYQDGEKLSLFLSEGEQLIRVFECPWPAKEGLLKTQMSQAVTLTLTGNDLFTGPLFFLSGEVLAGCCEDHLLPLVDGILQRKEVWDMEKPAGQLAGDYVLQEKGN